MDAPPPRARRPWWIPPFLGRVPELEPRLLGLLGLVSLGVIFENYDLSLINSALPQIAEELGIGAGETGYVLGWIRAGGIGTFLIVPFADRVGRRRIFLISLLGMSLGTLASGLAQSALQFTLAQAVSRAFLLSSMAIGVVILAEEFPAQHRGWAIGMMGALAGVGYGLGAAVYAAVDVLPFGWRALYAFGAIPALALPLFRARLAETGRFTRHRDAAGSAPAGSGLRALAELVRMHPRRALGVGLAGMLFAVGTIAVFQYSSYFVRIVHGWAPWQYTLMVLGGGLLGIFGNIAAGRLGDRFGRRSVGVSFLLLFPLAALLFYAGPSWSLALAFGAFVFCNTGAEVTLRTFSAELFPTSHRGTSVAWLMAVQTAGWVAGLMLIGVGTEEVGDLAGAILATTLAVALAASSLLLLPETRSRELEAISGAR